MPNVTIRIENSTRQAISDAQGQFTITEAPVGPVHLLVEASTTTLQGEWPSLSYNIVTVAGVDNRMAGPIFVVKIDTQNAVYVGNSDTVVTHPELPGFALEVKAGSVTFPDGSKEGNLSITRVNANKVPMPPPNGMQPQLIVTIQPHGAKFDPPAKLTLPNTDGHPPLAEVEMYSYDHDLEEFVTIGLGRVSSDGAVVTSKYGSGVIKAGWHCGSAPGGNGCGHDCPVCQDCDNNCVCQPVENDPRLEECKKCSQSGVVDIGKDEQVNCSSVADQPGDCRKPGCSNGSCYYKALVSNSDRPILYTSEGEARGQNPCQKCVAGEESAVEERVECLHSPDEDFDCNKPACVDGVCKPEGLFKENDISEDEAECVECFELASGQGDKRNIEFFRGNGYQVPACTLPTDLPEDCRQPGCKNGKCSPFAKWSDEVIVDTNPNDCYAPICRNGQEIHDQNSPVNGRELPDDDLDDCMIQICSGGEETLIVGPDIELDNCYVCSGGKKVNPCDSIQLDPLQLSDLAARMVGSICKGGNGVIISEKPGHKIPNIRCLGVGVMTKEVKKEWDQSQINECNRNKGCFPLIVP